MELEFGSLKELYEKILPAFTAKRSELKKIGFYHIMEADIWNYLSSTKWKISSDLSLHEMVNDIFDLNEDVINNYVIKKASLQMRNVDFDE